MTASFDTARGASQQEGLESIQALNDRFAAATVRIELFNRRTSTGSQFDQRFGREFRDWETTAQALIRARVSLQEIEAARATLGDELERLTSSEGWAGTAGDQRVSQIESAIAAVVSETDISDESADQVLRAWLAALRADRRLQDAILNAPVITAEYSLDRPDVATEAIGTVVPEGIRPPNVHTARLIYAQGLVDTRLDLTANVSFSWFDESRPGMKGHFRDLRAGIEGKFRLRDIANYGAPTLSFAGLYVYLHQEPLGLGLMAFNEADIEDTGHLGVFQTKLEFPTANNSMRIPISFTYSNRTELIRESDVRGQIGLSFNMDALFASP